MSETIDSITFARLAEAGAVRGAHIVGQGNAWAVMIKYGRMERPLSAKGKKDVRTFRRMETLISYLKDHGIDQFDVDASTYDPTAEIAVKRPDRAKALKLAHEAAAYDKWFKEQVQASIDDPRPSISDADARTIFAARRAELRNKVSQ